MYTRVDLGPISLIFLTVRFFIILQSPLISRAQFTIIVPILTIQYTTCRFLLGHRTDRLLVRTLRASDILVNTELYWGWY